MMADGLVCIGTVDNTENQYKYWVRQEIELFSIRKRSSEKLREKLIKKANAIW